MFKAWRREGTRQTEVSFASSLLVLVNYEVSDKRKRNNCCCWSIARRRSSQVILAPPRRTPGASLVLISIPLFLLPIFAGRKGRVKPPRERRRIRGEPSPSTSSPDFRFSRRDATFHGNSHYFGRNTGETRKFYLAFSSTYISISISIYIKLYIIY